MPRALGWYWRRLQAMPPAEMAHRALRYARYPVDRARMRVAPLVATEQYAHWPGPTLFYFDDAAVSSRALSPALSERVERLLAGERDVLGLGWMRLPDPPWHVEPSRDALWPRIDGVRALGAAPGLDARLTWELNRGHEWVLLARAWATTRQARYRDRVALELASWSENNPIGIGINWASAMEAAIRIHSLAWVAAFLRGTAVARIGSMIDDHARFVRRNLSEFSSANNHLIVELSALAVASRALDGKANAYALNRLELEAARQTSADGVNVEMATHYHTFVLEALLLVAHLERAHGSPRAELESVIHRMAAYVAAIRCDEGDLLHHGDNDDGALLPFFRDDHGAQLVEAAAGLRARTADRAHHEGVHWLLNGGSALVTRERQSRCFVAGGQVVLRSADVHVSFDAGPFGFGTLAAHAHCDALAVNIAVRGSPVFVERGTYRYNGAPESREEFRQTSAHNTLQVVGREQADVAGPFLWSRVPTIRLEHCDAGMAVASHTGFAPLIHARTVMLQDDGSLVVADRLTGGGAPCAVHYHLAPGLACRRTKGTVAPAFDVLGPEGTVRARLSVVPPPRGCTAEVRETRHSSVYAHAERAASLRFDVELGDDDWFLTVIGGPAHAPTDGEKLLAQLRSRGRP